jgi:hypothetical protein
MRDKVMSISGANPDDGTGDSAGDSFVHDDALCSAPERGIPLAAYSPAATGTA